MRATPPAMIDSGPASPTFGVLRTMPPQEYASRVMPGGTKPRWPGVCVWAAAAVGRQKLPSRSPATSSTSVGRRSSRSEAVVLLTPCTRNSSTSPPGVAPACGCGAGRGVLPMVRLALIAIIAPFRGAARM